jgi:hypothetical protein
MEKLRNLRRRDIEFGRDLRNAISLCHHSQDASYCDLGSRNYWHASGERRINGYDMPEFLCGMTELRENNVVSIDEARSAKNEVGETSVTVSV